MCLSYFMGIYFKNSEGDIVPKTFPAEDIIKIVSRKGIQKTI